MTSMKTRRGTAVGLAMLLCGSAMSSVSCYLDMPPGMLMRLVNDSLDAQMMGGMIAGLGLGILWSERKEGGGA